MRNEIIIERYGLGHAVVVLEQGKIIDCFMDPPQRFRFYPPNTFVIADIDDLILRCTSKNVQERGVAAPQLRPFTLPSTSLSNNDVLIEGKEHAKLYQHCWTKAGN